MLSLYYLNIGNLLTYLEVQNGNEDIFSLKTANNVICPGNEFKNAIDWYFKIYDQDKAHAHVGWAWNFFYNLWNSVKHDTGHVII